MNDKGFPRIETLIQTILAETGNPVSETEQKIDTRKITCYWKIGRILQHYIAENKTDDNFETGLINRIEPDLPIGRRLLYFSLNFFMDYPEEKTIPRNLSWTHLKLLQSIKSPEKRKEYQHAVFKHKLSSRNLQALIYKEREKPEPRYGQLQRCRPELYTYQSCRINETLCLDLGFSIYCSAYGSEISGLPGGKGIKTIKEGKNFRFISCPKPQYTYKASVVKITDGDTITVDIDLGFQLTTRQKLRLRGIDTPEMNTPEGIEARQFVSRELASLPFLVIKAYKRGKYARILADIFYSPGSDDPRTIINSGYFLNQKLLDNKLAVKYR